MKYVFRLGGASGFAAAAGASHLAGHAADRVFLDGAVGCLCGAILFRWFWNTVLRGVRETILQRHAAATAAQAAQPKPK
ncbi:MAG: hypothetical protein HZC55_01915 [Verrucomicrobia bacterium]|nr:hypothetical protein [Verrucomicrobiota bacterium]